MIMKRLGLIILLALAIPFVGWSQTSHQAVINSMGGGTSSGGVYTNFGIVGQVAQDSIRTDGNGTIWRSVGFIHAADNNVVIPVCDLPIGLQITAVEETTASFEWSAQAGVSYDYRFTVAGQNNWVETLDQTVGTAQLTALEAGTAYEFQLRTNCGNGLVSEWTESLNFETFQFAACDAPTDVTAAIDGQSAQVSWSLPANDFTDLRIRLRNNNDSEWPQATILGLSAVSNTFTGLVPGIYQVQVGTSCDGFTEPVYSSSILFQIDNPCVAPALTLGAITDNSLEVTWVADPAETYNLRIRPKGVFDWSDPAIASQTSSHIFSGLDDGIKYEMQIQADCGSGLLSEYGSLIEGETLGTPCAIPADLTATNVTQTTALLGWLPTNALFYNVRYRRKSTAAWSSFQPVTASLEVNSLIPGSVYEYQVKSVCVNNTPGSDFSPTLEFTTLPPDTPCLTPSVSSVVVHDGQQTGDVDISWTDESAINYEFRFRNKNALVWNVRQSQAKNISLTGLFEGARYEYQVRSKCGPTGSITSPWSVPAEFVIPTTVVCQAPANLVASTGQSGEILLSWDEAVAPGYVVKYRVLGFQFWSTQPMSQPTRLLGLEEGFTYEVTVATQCSADGSVVSAYTPVQTVVAGGTPVVCNVPGNVSATPGIGSVSIQWNGAPDTEDYLLRYRLAGSNFWNFVELSTNQFVSSTLQQSMTYQYQVREDCSTTLSSGWSVISEFTTGGVATCDVPQLDNAPLVGATNITVSWGPGVGALYYNLQYRLAGSVIWTTRPVVGNSSDVAGLQSGTAYQFRIQSVCDEDGVLRSAFSAVSTFSTDGPPSCELPTGIVVDAQQDITNISWTDVSDAAYYQLRYRLQGSPQWSLATSNGITDQVVLTNLVKGSVYEYQIRAICDPDNFIVSQYSGIATFQTPGDPCLSPIPTVGTVLGAPDLTATISWMDAPGSATADGGYVYRYRILGATQWQEIETSNTSVTLSQLAPGETYQFRVKSICDDVNNVGSPFSTIISFNVPGESICTIPTGLETINTGPRTADIVWLDNGSETYDLQYRAVGSQLWITMLDTEFIGLTISGLIPEEDYEWRVRSDCSTGASSNFSPLATFTTTAESNLVANQSFQIDSNESDLRRISNLAVGEKSEVDDKVDPASIQSIAQMSIDLYPNPFRERVNLVIHNPNDAHVTVTMFNLAGMRILNIFEGGLSANQNYGFEIDGTTLNNGVYMIVINGIGDQRIVKRVMLKR